LLVGLAVPFDSQTFSFLAFPQFVATPLQVAGPVTLLFSVSAPTDCFGGHFHFPQDYCCKVRAKDRTRRKTAKNYFGGKPDFGGATPESATPFP